jgi:hypothetical protein
VDGILAVTGNLSGTPFANSSFIVRNAGNPYSFCPNPYKMIRIDDTDNAATHTGGSPACLTPHTSGKQGHILQAPDKMKNGKMWKQTPESCGNIEK